LGPIPKPQSPIPNPQSPFVKIYLLILLNKNNNKNFYLISNIIYLFKVI